MKFTLFSASTGEDMLWTETKTVSVSKGIFSTALGDTAPLTTYYLNKMETEIFTFGLIFP
jgi:hypothetical protein